MYQFLKIRYMLPHTHAHTHTHTHTYTHTHSAHKVISGHVRAERPHPGVDVELLTEISKWQEQDIDWKDIVNRLRPRIVPLGMHTILGRQVRAIT